MTKPYLIMLPGWGMKNYIWNNINKYLSQDYELIFIEWVHVQSLREFKESIINVIEQKQISAFSLLGWSMGSLVALDIASDNRWNIEHLILIGSTSSFVLHKKDGYNIGWDKRIVERMKCQLYKKPKDTLNHFYNAMFSTKESQKGYDNQFLQMGEHCIQNQSIDSLALGLDYLIQKDLRNKLSAIALPTLMIHGENDSICPLDNAIYIKNRIIYSRLKIISHAGHIPFFTEPIACYNAISHFTRRDIERKEEKYD